LVNKLKGILEMKNLKIDNLKSIILNDEDISTLINDLYYN